MDDLPPPGPIPASVLRSGLNLQQVKSLLRHHGVSIRSVDNHHWQISQGWRSALWMTGEGKGGEEAGLDDEALQRLALVLRQSGLLQEEPPGLPSPPSSPPPLRPMRAAILWIGAGATRVYWVNDLALAEGSPFSLGHWLHQEFTLHRSQRSVPYLRRILAMLERIERVLLVGQRPPAQEGEGQGQARDQGGAGHAEESRAVGSQAGGTTGKPFTDQPSAGEGVALLNELLEQLRPDLRRRVVGVISLEGDQLDDALLFTIARTYLLPQGGNPTAG